MVPTYQPRAWHLVVVALIVVFDLIVLYMVIKPNVTDDYRAYYIDRSASCFPRADNVATGYYPLGEPITFVPDRSGFDLDTVRWCGFMPPSNTGIRSFGDYGVLRINMPLPDDDFLLTFSSWANTDSSKPERDVQVLVNAITSAEDKRFFQHSGFDPIRIIKAAYIDIRERRKEQGASTLSMQLARMF